MAFIDPGDNGHQFDGIHLEFLQMGNDGGMCQGADGAAQRLRYFRMPHREAAHIQFIDQPAIAECRRLKRHLCRVTDKALWHQRGGVKTAFRQARIKDKGPVQRQGIGIGQQFAAVEQKVLFGCPSAVSTIAIGLSGLDACHKEMM